jgi:hypothetical protein
MFSEQASEVARSYRKVVSRTDDDSWISSIILRISNPCGHAQTCTSVSHVVCAVYCTEKYWYLESSVDNHFVSFDCVSSVTGLEGDVNKLLLGEHLDQVTRQTYSHGSM